MSKRNYIRTYFYRIDARGRLYHDGTEQNDAGFLDFFFKRVEPNDTGEYPEYPYISPCGKEMNFIRSAGTPLVFKDLISDGSSLIYGATLTVPFRPEELRRGSDDQLYHPAPFAVGRIHPELLLRWQDFLDFDEDWIIRPDGPFSSLGGPLSIAKLSPDLDEIARIQEER
ncbi:MAG: hypothetical protein CMN76_19190 [Spirochaetaceae bacterium]|nr:hypothetical protein [Spirochaetaceae bacterium]|tara:strand:+ start:71849 stop:72358 length:510 start_codon:yes stop_codon:yes gene_type:complete